MPYILGKITRDTPRKSLVSPRKDSCEPSILLYFRGDNAREDFRRAVELLEAEFPDADIIGAPVGKRPRDGEEVEQWGPSFTKKRNRLMYYTQGGFTESGRDYAARSKTLGDNFEGENYFLHKGHTDPLADLPCGITSLSDFVDEMSANVVFFDKPFHLIKLQQVLQKLEGNNDGEVEKLRSKILTLMLQIASKMHPSLSRKRSLVELLSYGTKLPDVSQAALQALYSEKKTYGNFDDLNPLDTLSYIEYIENKAQENIDRLNQFITDLQSKALVSFSDIYKSVPKSMCDMLFDWEPLVDFYMDDLCHRALELVKQGVAANDTIDWAAVHAKLHEEKDGQRKGHVRMDFSIDRGIFKVCKMRGSDLALSGGLFDSSGDGNDRIKFPWDLLKINHSLQYQLNKQILKLKCEWDPVIAPLGSSVSSTNTEKNLIDRQVLIDNLNLLIQKFQSVIERQNRCSEALDNHQKPFIPFYYHATPSADTLASIAETGIDVLKCGGSLGAFASHDLEPSYGPVGVGFSRTVEFEHGILETKSPEVAVN